MAKGMRAAVGAIGLTAVLWLGGCVLPDERGDEAAPTEDTGGLKPLSHGSPDEIRALARRVTSFQVTTPYREGELVASTADQGHPVTAQFLLSDGEVLKSRWPSRSGGWRLCDATTKTAYSYLPERGYVTRGKLTSRADSPYLRDIDNMLSQPAEISFDTVDGGSCYKVWQKGRATAGAFTLWFDCTYGLPRQTQRRGRAEKLVYDRINAIPPSEFEPPAGVAIYDENAQPPRGTDRSKPLSPTPAPTLPPPTNQPLGRQTGPAPLPASPQQPGGRQPLPSPDEANQPTGAAAGMRR
ncbi:MAG: hypothetical protein HZB16_16130 [Armatimonadetes bacterium]|nr:hypothetical protein [Armatimonadota bacterium]